MRNPTTPDNGGVEHLPDTIHRPLPPCSVVIMTEDNKQPTIEELQQQILEMKETSEKQAAEMQQMKDSLSKSEESLKAARDLNAKLMSKVPGEGQPEPEKKDDPYEGLDDMETLEKMTEEMVDKVAEREAAKHKKKE